MAKIIVDVVLTLDDGTEIKEKTVIENYVIEGDFEIVSLVDGTKFPPPLLRPAKPRKPY